MNMKQLIISLLIIFAAQSAYGQTAAQIFDLFKDKPKAEYVHVPRLLLSFAKKFASKGNDEEAKMIMSHIHSVRVLDLEDCDKNVKDDFIRETHNLNTNGYEPMVRVNEDGEKVMILTKSKDDVISEMLVLVSSQDDCTLVQIKGKINQDEINRLVDDNTHKKKK